MASGQTARLTGAPDGLQQLSTVEGAHWLARHHEGRLGYLSGRGPQRVVVRYALAGDQLLFLLPDYHEAVHYAPGEQVSLIVDGPPAGAEGYQEVRVSGTAQLGAENGEPVVAELSEQWPDDLTRRLIRLPLTELTGLVRTPGPR